MLMQTKRKHVQKNNYLKNEELIANQYALKSANTVFIITTIVWILNLLNVFVVDATIMKNCYITCAIIYFSGRIVCALCDMSKWWVKYFLLFWIVAILTVLNVFLTFHAVMVYLLPIVYMTMYSSKKLVLYTYILTVLSIAIGVFGGIFIGLPDENIVWLPLDKAALYFVLPRCMVCIAFVVACANIAKIINVNVKYAQKMENLAEIDGMTGLYNKSKYLDMISNFYINEEKLAVIFWDINYLKKTNDTIGHEAGDKLILTVAESIRNVCNTSDTAYRVGGDEFIMIMCGADDKAVAKKIHDWTVFLNQLKKNIDFEISVSVGYACGKGKDLDAIIHNADQMMYENKRLFHKENECKELNKQK